jgi:outer membrane receptor protein involved in Fe transport
MSGYLQDKIELRDLVLNVGIRYDRIDPNAWQFRQIAVQKDAAGNKIPGTGMFGGDNQFDQSDVKPSDAYSYISPRLGVSFPVSDQTIFHAQYGKFYQKPSLMDLYLSPFYLDNFVQGGYFTTIDNPNLRPEKTTGYELGFNQLLGSIASLQLTTFYKETEDLIQVLPVETDSRQIAFTQNGDFGVVKGFDFIFTLRRFNNVSASINYEYQTAKGTGSATNDNYNIAWLNAARGNYPKFTMPLSFQQTHRGAVNLDYRLAKDQGPSVFGIRPLEQAGVNLLFSFNSGQPFTRMAIQNRQPHNGRYDNSRISTVPVSAVNGVNSPWNYRFDLKVDKTVPVPGTPFTVNAYLWVLNLFNTENAVLVWNTGLADQTGYLQTEPGKAYYESLTADQRKALSMREMDWGNYGIPRQIRLGLAVSF